MKSEHWKDKLREIPSVRYLGQNDVIDIEILIQGILPNKDKVRQILTDKNWNKRSVDIILEELEEILI